MEVETNQLHTPCKEEIERILSLVIESITSYPRPQEKEETESNQITLLTVEEEMDIDKDTSATSRAVDLNEDVLGVYTCYTDKEGKDGHPVLECIHREENKRFKADENESPEEKGLFTKALDLVCSHQISLSQTTSCSNVTSLKVLAAEKSSGNKSYQSCKAKEPETVHFPSPVAVVYEYTVSQSSSGGSTQCLSDEDSEDINDAKEYLELDKKLENLKEITEEESDKPFYDGETLELPEVSVTRQMASYDYPNDVLENEVCENQDASYTETENFCDLKQTMKGHDCHNSQAAIQGIGVKAAGTDKVYIEEESTKFENDKVLNHRTLDVIQEVDKAETKVSFKDQEFEQKEKIASLENVETANVPKVAGETNMLGDTDSEELTHKTNEIYQDFKKSTQGCLNKDIVKHGQTLMNEESSHMNGIDSTNMESTINDMTCTNENILKSTEVNNEKVETHQNLDISLTIDGVVLPPKNQKTAMNVKEISIDTISDNEEYKTDEHICEIIMTPAGDGSKSDHSSCESGSLNVETKLKLSPVIPVNEIFHKDETCFRFARSPDLFLETGNENYTELSVSAKYIKSEDEDCLMKEPNDSVDSAIVSSPLTVKIFDTDEQSNTIRADIRSDHETSYADKLYVLQKNQNDENHSQLMPCAQLQESVADCGDIGNTLGKSIQQDNKVETCKVETCQNSRKRKLFHPRQETNYHDAKVIKIDQSIQEGSLLNAIDELLKQPAELRALASKALDKEEEDTVWFKSSREHSNSLIIANKDCLLSKDNDSTEEKEKQHIDQSLQSNKSIKLVKTNFRSCKIESLKRLDSKDSEHSLNDQVEIICNEETIVETTKDNNNISEKDAENVEYPDFVSTAEHLSQTSQGSSTGFVFNGQAPVVVDVLSSQVSEQSIGFLNDVQTAVNETKSDDNKMYYELAEVKNNANNDVVVYAEKKVSEDVDATNNDLNNDPEVQPTGQMKTSYNDEVDDFGRKQGMNDTDQADKDIDMELDLGDLDRYIDKTVDQIVPGEDTRHIDDDNSDRECSKEDETKVYARDMDIFDDADRPLCNKVEKTGQHAVTGTGCFNWKYAPSCDLDNATQSNLDLEDQVVRILPLKTCGKPIRVGLSRKQSIGHLHKMKTRKPL